MVTENSFPQRRAHARKPGLGVIELIEGGSVVARGSLRNLSDVGLGIADLEPMAPRTFAKGERFHVRFSVEGHEVEAEARIQWVNGGQRELGLKMTGARGREALET